MKPHLCLICCILVLICLCGCMQTQLTTEYVNDQLGVGLDPPENWVALNLTTAPWVMSWYPSLEGNVSLMMSSPYRLDEGLALSVFADDIEETFSEKYMNFSVVSRDWLTVDGMTAYQIEYQYVDNMTSILEKQVAIKRNRDVYIMRYSASETEYNVFIDEVNESIQSFRVK